MKKTYTQMVKEHLSKTDSKDAFQQSVERAASIRESEIELFRLTDFARRNRQKNANQSKSNCSPTIDLFEYTPPTELEFALATLKRLSISGDSV